MLLQMLLVVAACLSLSHAAPFALNNYFSSNMVLQRAPQQAVVWGYGEPGTSVTVAMDGTPPVATTTVPASGRWSVQLPATPMSLNRTVAVSNGTATVTLANVAFGDVYLCSGQSNMQMTLTASFNGFDAMAAASRYSNIRLFSIPSQISNWTLEQATLSYRPSSWVLPANNTLNGGGVFSATCYWTGLHLSDSLHGTVPIGLVQSSVGGTSVAAWTSNITNYDCGPMVTPYGQDNVARNWPSVEYNAMINPLLPMRLTGVLWYQGETDWWDVDRYACSFPNLIKDWRANFNYPSLPFYFVLIHPYSGASPGSRQSQQQALLLPNVGVANAIDVGDRYGSSGDIHPRNKSYVGARLARWLRRDIYGQQLVVDGPKPASVTARVAAGSRLTLVLHFSNDASSDGLFALATPDCAANTTAPRRCCSQTAPSTFDSLIGYTYQSGNQQVTAYSGAAVIDPAARTIRVTNETAVGLLAGGWLLVSYAQVDWPGCALYNEARLPALPFRINVTVSGGSVASVLQLNNYFSSNMVLQRAPQQAVMWGYGVPDSTITVHLDGNNVTAGVVSSVGTWSVKLPATETSLNHNITASDGTTTITLTNVAFGDVYLCSGQSNMQVTLNFSFGGADAIAGAASYSNIRLFSMYQTYRPAPLNESATVAYAPNSWVLPSYATLQYLTDSTNPWNYFSAACYWTGLHLSNSLNHSIPIGLVHASYGGTMIEAWTSPDTNTKCGPLVYPPMPNPQDRGSVIYNAMIHPLLPMRFTAVLWYQGESDWFAVDRYACSFPNMIDDWRTKFGYGPALPFYFVLLAPYAGCDPRLRQAQLAAFPSQNVGVANAIDVGDRYGLFGDIHPRNKSYVGARLARWIRRDIYGQQLVVDGPKPASVTARVAAGSRLTLVLHFSNDASSDGLFALATPDCAANTTAPRRCCSQTAPSTFDSLIGYTYQSGNQQVTAYSGAAVIDPAARTIRVTNETAVGLLAGGWLLVSYAQVDWPGCALYNEARLPALPFRINVTVSGGSVASVLQLNNYFSSNMVLQRAPQQAVMWGYGVPDSTITVHLDGNNVTAGVVSSVGTWSVKLPATETSLNHNITASDGTTTITLTNVAFGDVYLCSGQSNMQVTLNYSFGAADAMAAASKYPNLRLFNVPNQISNWTLDQATLSYSPDSWVLPAANTLQNARDPADRSSYFSATCYWTGMQLYDALNGTVPIGLVQSSVGGTAVQAWTSNATNYVCGPLVTPFGQDNVARNWPSAEYNAMINPLLPMRFAAVLWYQGETDWWDVDRYACSFPNLIKDWRTNFNYPSLPFYFVLIHPYSGASPGSRQAQQQALKLPNVGVANAIDLGDRYGAAGDIHPRNKSYVGARLARWLRRDIYGQQLVVEGPKVASVMASKVGADFSLTLQFAIDTSSNSMFALATPDCIANTTAPRRCCSQTAPNTFDSLIGYTYLSAGSNVTVYSTAAVLDPTARTITVTDSTPTAPPAGSVVTVSYAQVDWPGCAMYNEARLPALPFQMSVQVTGGTVPSVLRLNNYFSPNMVLQRSPQQAVMWGFGVPDSNVTVRLDGVNVATGVVSSIGSWSVQLPATDASLNHNITASDGTTTITLTNVAFGDVYLCSGQSNMHITLNYTFGGAAAMARAANYPNLRLYSKPMQNLTEPSNETAVTYAPNSWVLPAADTLQNPNDWTDVESYFSATCYWTGISIYDSLNGSIPIGLVHSSFGGTVAVAWTSPDAVTKCGAVPVFPPGVWENQPFNQPSVLYNAMLYPLLPMRFTAVLWYQGESDWWDSDHYACAFPNLISDMRAKFGYTVSLPFYFVLLAPYGGYNGTVNMVRQAQLATWPAESVRVASAIDLGDKGGSHGEIHPRNKSYLGERLARWVRSDIYHQTHQVWAQGPEPIRDQSYVSVTSASNGSATTVTVVVTYVAAPSGDGLYMLPSPGCTTCCTSGAGLLWVTINDTAAGGTNSTSWPAVTIDQTAATLTGTFNLPTPPSSQAIATIGLQAEDWPQCILYNQYQLPAMPFVITVAVTGGGGGGGGDDDDGSSMWLWAGVAAGVLVAVGVVIWLVVHYGRKRHAASGAAGAGSRDVDERRTNLLDDSDDSTTAVL